MLKQLQSERGFTLLEVLAAFVLLALMSALVIGIFLNGYKSITKMGDRSEKMHITRSLVEQSSSGTAVNLNLPNASGSGSITISGEEVNALIDGTASSNITLFIPTPPAWTSGTSYTLHDKVRHNNVNYICLVPHVADSSNKPHNTSSYWKVTSS
ncbi:carbohydrate-binding protein [Paenibacillus aquistagni]|uniref:Prepilin-type N-terminal cleavage/methylation domain-containing protein n=1 Tax=Paenibacillus aquistagni TaxID=1852522 RepID=A0A1X7LRU3_9BACL|nr:carbohydrate-binding protein [Paenibacillus aquistagni]SMG56618.1 prepilin-type N-terminal cleavage/methylation domain-containing protein [Paenibacillus aquistagni]